MQYLSVAVINHGCKLNQFEGEAVTQSFRNAGFGVVQWSENPSPDIVVVNTCTVTEKSDRKSRHTILKAGRHKPKGGLVVVTGCYAETERQEISKLDGVDLVVGLGDKPRLVEMVRARLAGDSVRFDSPASPFLYTDPEHQSRARAVVKVQDGCDMRCAYCKVPLARGRSVSRDSSDIAASVEKIAQNGFREVVLTGVNLGDYRYEGSRLSDLIRLILKRTEGVRVRLSSIEPAFFEKGLFDLIADERIAPHFHIPLQSGSDRTLERMNRPYSVSGYTGIIEEIRRSRPESHIATDLIVGFPTENEEDFSSTVKAVEKLRFASVHVFRYSTRPGTNGAMLPDDVSYEKKSRRSKELIDLGRRLNREYREQFIGTQRNTVLELHEDVLKGVTDNYIRVTIENAPVGKELLSRKLASVLITRLEGDITWAGLSRDTSVL
jgi:threonylcarbamoyladenosine tRNA methylthiotransferase MtaB